MSDVTKFPIKPKPRPDEVQLELVSPFGKTCDHRNTGFTVDESLLEVSCRGCGEKLNPVWAIARLAEQESTWKRTREAYIEESKRRAERRSTKCQHCGQMTRIRNL